jgi:hypothetical protein
VDPSQSTYVEVDRQHHWFINFYQLPDGPHTTHQEFLNLFEGLAEAEFTYESARLRGPVTPLQLAAVNRSRRLILRHLRIGVQQYFPQTPNLRLQLRNLQTALNGFCQLRIRYKAAENIQRIFRGRRQRREYQLLQQVRMAHQNNQIIQQIAALAAAIQNQVNLGHPNMPAREVNLVKIESFDGTGDPIAWLEQFESAAIANGLTDARKLAVAPAYLTGTALAWLQERQANQATNPVHWTVTPQNNAQPAVTFRQPFIDHFRNNARIAMWQQELDNHKQLPGQTVDQYVTKMQQLMKRIDPVNVATEHQKVSTFMRGLDSRYKFHVRAANPVTLIEAVNTAKGFELSYNELASQPVGIVQNNNKEIVALLGEMQKQLSTFGNQSQAGNSNNDNRSNRWSGNNNNNRSNTNSFGGNCHNCGKKGHMMKDCWSRQNNNNSNGNNNRSNNRFNNRSGGNWRNNNDQNNNNPNNNRNSNNNSNNNRTYHFNDTELADYVKAIMKENKDLKD